MPKMENVSQFQDTVVPYLIKYGLQVIAAILIFIIGWVAAKWISRKIEKMVVRSEHLDTTLAPIMEGTVRVLILVVTLLAVLSKFGIRTTSLVAVLGSVGLAIGLAIQGTLSNIASGIMLITLRPFGTGDAVDINGTLGIVDEIGLFMTEMHSFDNIYISIPNSKVWGNEIKNLTRLSTRRIDLEFGIHYKDDMDKAMGLIKEVLDGDERVLAEPEPLIAVGTLADNSVQIRVRPWTQTENAWPLRYDLTKDIKARFDEEDITIPFPQRDVHFFREKQEEDLPEDAK